MPQINLSALSGPELRQMLDASRRRGDAALTYKVLQEMAARRQASAARGPRLLRRPAEPHLVAVELDEPVETDDVPPMPNWRAPPREPETEAAPPQRAAAPAPAGRRPRKSPPARPVVSAVAEPVAAAEVAPAPRPAKPSQLLSLPDPKAATTADPGLPPRPAEPEIPRAPRRSHLQLVAVFALGLAAGVGLGRWGSAIVLQAASPAAAPVRTAALAPAHLPAPMAPIAAQPAPAPAAPAPAPEAPPDAVGPPSPDPGEGSGLPSNAQELARDVDSRAPESQPSPPPTARAAEAIVAAAPVNPVPVSAAAGRCATAATPADREICSDPNLRRLQRELQRAYAAALEAHQDRVLLRQRQLAWRDARNIVSDPDRLARLYEQRIRKLNAATVEARQPR